MRPTPPKVSIRPGSLEPAILKIIEKYQASDQIPVYLQDYIDRKEISNERFTEPVRVAMVDYLLDRGAKFSGRPAVRAGDYDELFALAYEHALVSASGRSDPIDAARQPGGGLAGSTWDFTVDTFDEIEAQGVVRDNIMAAGALDYIYELGERLGIFRLVDALMLNWASGSIDIVDGAAASRLYRYWKMRDQRATAEERGVVYRRVLNKGTTEVLSRMVVNEPFTGLWENLLSEVADYIDKSERVKEGSNADSPVSRSRIFQATRDLQFNLTEHCTGMAHIQAREFYAQFNECIDILSDPEILAFFGGNRRKSMWTVIEQLSRKEFGTAPSIAPIRSLAVDGNAIFRWIADFSEGSVRQDDFNNFLRAAEAYILNASTVGEFQAPQADEDAGDEEDLEDAEDEESKDGEDF